MKDLFNYGYQRALAGYVWDKQPPGFKNALDLDIEKNTESNILSQKIKGKTPKKSNTQKAEQLN